MEVGPSDPSCSPHPSQHIASLKNISYSCADLRQVPVKGVDPQPMIQNDGIACEKQLIGQNHPASLRGVHGRSCGPRQIRTSMGRPWISVKNSALPEVRAGRYSIQWYTKSAIPQPLRGNLIENLAQSLALFVGALDLFRVWLNELFPYLQPFRRKLSCSHGDPRAASNLPSGSILRRKGCR